MADDRTFSSGFIGGICVVTICAIFFWMGYEISTENAAFMATKLGHPDVATAIKGLP